MGAATEESDDVVRRIEGSYGPREVQDTQAINMLLVLGRDSDTDTICGVSNGTRVESTLKLTDGWYS
jgi:hypothetical protein